MEPGPHRLLAASHAVWLAGGILAYTTTTSLLLATAFALIPALLAVLELRALRPHPLLELALAGVVGTWAVVVIMVVTPYVATEEGVSLWTSRGFAAVGVAVASLGMLLWSWCTWRGTGGDARAGWLYTAFHGAALVAAMAIAAGGDGARRALQLRGDTYAVVDLQVAPALAVVAAVPWLLAFLRAPQAEASQDV